MKGTRRRPDKSEVSGYIIGFDITDSTLDCGIAPSPAQCVAVIKRYQRQTAMNREERRTDAGLKPQAGVVALFREDEFLGLAVEAVAKAKSRKSHAHPSRHPPPALHDLPSPRSPPPPPA